MASPPTNQHFGTTVESSKLRCTNTPGLIVFACIAVVSGLMWLLVHAVKTTDPTTEVTTRLPFSRPIPPQEDINTARLQMVPLRALMMQEDSRVVVFEESDGNVVQLSIPGTVPVELDMIYLITEIGGRKTFCEISRSDIDPETGRYISRDDIGP